MRLARIAAALDVMTSLALATLATAQTPKDDFDALPKAVKKTVKAKYPEAKFRGVAKEKNEEGKTVYEIEMTVAGKAIDIMIDLEGDIETTEEEIDVEDLPKVIKAAATRAYPEGKLTKAEKVTDEEDKVTYEVFVKLGKAEPFELLMSKSGKILKDGSKPAEKVEKKEKEEKDDDEKEEKTRKPKD